MSFDFSQAYLLYSNLGGQGPDVGRPQSIRYLNVGSVSHPSFGSIHFDLELTNRSAYTPYDSSLNTVLNGKFAQINLASNKEVQLRATMLRSCASAPSCLACMDAALSEAAKTSCFASGCACYGTTVYTEADCSGAAKVAARQRYACAQMSTKLVLPREALVTMSVYDFDTGPNGDYLERLTVPSYEYYKTPLRATVGGGVGRRLDGVLATHSAPRLSCCRRDRASSAVCTIASDLADAACASAAAMSDSSASPLGAAATAASGASATADACRDGDSSARTAATKPAP